jgi:hypothetical protein
MIGLFSITHLNLATLLNGEEESYFREITITDTVTSTDSIIQITRTLTDGMESDFSNVKYYDVSGNELLQEYSFDADPTTLKLQLDTTSTSTIIYEKWGIDITASESDLSSASPIPYFIDEELDVWIDETIIASSINNLIISDTSGYTPTNTILPFIDEFNTGSMDASKWHMENGDYLSFDSDNFILRGTPTDISGSLISDNSFSAPCTIEAKAKWYDNNQRYQTFLDNGYGGSIYSTPSPNQAMFTTHSTLLDTEDTSLTLTTPTNYNTYKIERKATEVNAYQGNSLLATHNFNINPIAQELSFIQGSIPKITLYTSTEVSGNAPSGSAAVAQMAFTPVDASSVTKEDGYLIIDIKCNNPSYAAVGSGALELSSSGTCDVEEINYGTPIQRLGVTSDWQTFTIPLSTMATSGGTIDFSQLDYIRIYTTASGGDLFIYWRNAYIVQTDKIYIDWVKVYSSYEINPSIEYTSIESDIKASITNNMPSTDITNSEIKLDGAELGITSTTDSLLIYEDNLNLYDITAGATYFNVDENTRTLLLNTTGIFTKTFDSLSTHEWYLDDELYETDTITTSPSCDITLETTGLHTIALYSYNSNDWLEQINTWDITCNDPNAVEDDSPSESSGSSTLETPTPIIETTNNSTISNIVDSTNAFDKLKEYSNILISLGILLIVSLIYFNSKK